MKICSICNIEKNDNEFRKGRKQCKKCYNEYEMNRRNKNKQNQTFLTYRIVECNYIGVTKDLKERKNNHKKYLNPNSQKYNRKLYKFIRDNNLDFNSLTFKILKDNLPDEETARKWETTFIIFYNSIDNGTNRCYSAFGTEMNKNKSKNYLKNVYSKTENFKSIQRNYRKSEKGKQTKKQYYEENKYKYQEKVKCDMCEELMNKSSIKRHISRKH